MITNVIDFYDQKSILILGCTGFVGKVLLEKLLYSCPGIDNIYLIVRHKKDCSIEKRLEQMFDKPLFARLKQDNPTALQKVVPINGDITLKSLGLKDDDEKTLIDKVSVVFHLAANIRFNIPMEEMIQINVDGVERILNLCHRMKKIQRFVYMSTAYSNADKSIIEEKVYPPQISMNNLRKLLLSGTENNKLNKYMKGMPNYYTLTKALAEDCVNRNHGSIPSIIIRPSIVTSSKSEPMEGWIDSWAGAAGLSIPIGRGIVRIVMGKSSNIVDIIPVDYVVNLTIAAAAAKMDNVKDVLVYNSSTSEVNPITLETILNIVIEYCMENKLNVIPKPSITFTMSKNKLRLISLFKQTLPLYMADISLHLRGKEAKYMQTLKNMLFMRKLLEPFTSNSWIICTQRTRTLAESLSESDKTVFYFNPMDINWPEYMYICCAGMHEFLIK